MCTRGASLGKAGWSATLVAHPDGRSERPVGLTGQMAREGHRLVGEEAVDRHDSEEIARAVWVLICQRAPLPPLAEVFPDVTNRDAAYEFTRNQPTLTWQKVWWRMSGNLEGFFLRTLCETWSCTIEDLLAPVEQRRWSDACHLDDETPGPVEGYLLRRPTLPS